MSIKKHKLYSIYESYIDSKNKSQGAKILLKNSESNFNEFIKSYDDRDSFRDYIDKIHISSIRNEKIDDIFDEFNI
jgi:translation initiation factor RLI1